MEYFIRSGGQGTEEDLAQIVLKLVCNFDYKKRGKNTTASQSGSKKPPAITPHFSGFRMLATGTEARLSNNITLTKISGKGHTMIDYFVMQNRKTFSFDYQRKVVEWNYFADARLFLNLTGGYFNQVQVTSSQVASVKVADSEKLLEAMKRSAKYMPGELYEQVKALLTPEAIAGMAAFGAAYVASQLTPVGWIADALVAVMFIGGVIFMGTELIEVGKLLIKFYETATNASSDAQYDEAGKYFAEAVTKVGVDVIVLIVFHKATKAVDRKIIKIKSNSGGGGGNGGKGEVGSKKGTEFEKPKEGEPEPTREKSQEPHEKTGSGARKATAEESAKIDNVRKDFKISGKKNIAYVEGQIDGKPVDLKSYSGTDTRPGTVDPIPLENQQLKTQPTSGDIANGQTTASRRAYDSEVKALEKILNETSTDSKGKIKLVSERDLCGSCSDAVSQFKKLRPNIKVETVFSKPYHNPL
jgi:The  BURPS668_1122 family of deaminases